jgi:hypothetical protein
MVDQQPHHRPGLPDPPTGGDDREETLSPADEATISLDWLPELKDGRLVFQVRLTRGDQSSAFDVGIDPARLQQSEFERLQTVLARRQNLLSGSQEIYTSIAWLLGIALTQEGLSKEERQAKIDALLLHNPISYKEQLIRRQKENFRARSGGHNFLEGAEDLDYYDEVYRSLQNAVYQLNVGTPQFPSADAREQAELEIFFLRLRHESVPDTFARHKVLYEKWDTNQEFLDAVAVTIQNRHHPSQSKIDVDYYVLCCWLDHYFWLLSNKDRAILLEIYTGIEVSADVIRKITDKYGLKDWSDFQPKGTTAPCYVNISYEYSADRQTKHKVFQILPRDSGKNC